MNAELELQGAIVTILSADPVLIALSAARVYDRVPEAPEFPYISIGPVDSGDEDADCITGLDVFQQIDVWSRDVGFPECKRIVDAVRAALHDVEIDLPTNALANLQCRQARIFRDPDGLTSHGALSFEANIERA